MNEDYRDSLFASYSRSHVAHLDLDEDAKREWFFEYTTKNYLPIINHFDRTRAEVLELACNRGYLLRALSLLGFQRLRGIDLSPDDITRAQELAPQAEVSCGDIFDYLDQETEQFDLIILKALLEHIPKQRIIPLLEAIRRSLRPGGMVLIDVPNMDWLLAAHERYMDFTHETGFTKESLGQVMRNVFSNVTLKPGAVLPEPGLKGSLVQFLRPCLIGVAQIILKVIGEGASDVWWHSRSLIATGQKPSNL
jgi:SAM-dependent methyltransferase